MSVPFEELNKIACCAVNRTNISGRTDEGRLTAATVELWRGDPWAEPEGSGGINNQSPDSALIGSHLTSGGGLIFTLAS